MTGFRQQIHLIQTFQTSIFLLPFNPCPTLSSSLNGLSMAATALPSFIRERSLGRCCQSELQQLYLKRMQLETLVLRISECIDDLGLLLDQIYKFPPKQREAFFDKIQTLKNRLLLLKTNARETTTAHTEKQYKQIYLAMNSLKNDIHSQATLILSTKENREINRSKEQKDKRTHADTMKVLLEKEEEIGTLKSVLFQKEETIRTQFEEIRKVKYQLEIVMEESRKAQFGQTAMQVDVGSANAALVRAEEELLDFRIRDQERDQAFHSALDQLERLKEELLAANIKIDHYEQLAEISIKKTRMVEENIKKVERQAQDLNDNYRFREHDGFKKLREFTEMEFQLNTKNETIRQLELQNKRLREDLAVLENELAKSNHSHLESKANFSDQREKLQLDLQKLAYQIDSCRIREEQLRKIIEEADKKYTIVIGKLNAAEEYKTHVKQAENRIVTYEERVRRLQLSLEQIEKEKKSVVRERDRVNQQLEKTLLMSRQFEVEIFKYKEKIRVRDEERSKYSHELELYQNKLREYERAFTLRELNDQSIENELLENKAKTIKIEQKYRLRQKQIESLKKRLLHAKIQTIHEIREVIG